MNSLKSIITAALLLAASAPVYADCAADASVRDVTNSYKQGQNAEKAGDLRAAFGHYVAAQEYTCDPNPVARAAAERAAGLSRPLAQAAIAKGDHAAAFDFYEGGGQFRDADRALITWTEARPDDPALYTKAAKHFEYRASGAFRENESVRLSVTGKYELDPALPAHVRGMPLRGVERALAAEAKAFDEKYLQQRLALSQSRPENPLDSAALQKYTASAQALQKSHPRDIFEESRDALELVRKWGLATTDSGEERQFEQRRQERALARVAALTGKYAAAPDLLKEAVDYVAYTDATGEARTARAVQIRSQSEKLGDAAMAQQKLMLADDYYAIAGAEDKARRAREQLNARMQQQMQPGIDAARKAAEDMAASYADPAKVAAMQQQAREMQRQMQETAAAGRSPAAQKSRDDFAKELGL